MAWRYSKCGKSIGCPSSEHGLYVEGPLTSEDWKVILEDVANEMVEQAKREGREEGGD